MRMNPCSQKAAIDLAVPPNASEYVWSFTTGDAPAASAPLARNPFDLRVAEGPGGRIDLSWSAERSTGWLAYQVSCGAWPDGDALFTETRPEVGGRLADLPEGQ